jgi:hypothetical protein
MYINRKVRNCSQFLPFFSYPLIRIIKGIVSRDFEVCFLVPLDSSDIATPSFAGSFFLKSRFCDEFLIFLALALVVFAVYESRFSVRRGSFHSPGQCTTKDWVKIGLQHNNRYSFDSVRPGLTLKFW